MASIRPGHHAQVQGGWRLDLHQSRPHSVALLLLGQREIFRNTRTVGPPSSGTDVKVAHTGLELTGSSSPGTHHPTSRVRWCGTAVAGEHLCGHFMDLHTPMLWQGPAISLGPRRVESVSFGVCCRGISSSVVCRVWCVGCM